MTGQRAGRPGAAIRPTADPDNEDMHGAPSFSIATATRASTAALTTAEASPLCCGVQRPTDRRARSASGGARPEQRWIMPMKECQKAAARKDLSSTGFCTIRRVPPPQDDDTADLLAPVPAVRTGDLVGYAHACPGPAASWTGLATASR